MEKTIFLFQRHKDRSREDFAAHYIERHAPLGARLTRSLLGYTVNLVETEGGPDAITEHWLHDAMDLLTPDIAYASPEDFAAVVADDRTLFDDFVLHVAVAETILVAAEPCDTSPGALTPEPKLIWLYPDAKTAPPPPPGARRVVDNHIGYKLVFEDGLRKRVAPDYALIRMAWGLDQAVAGPEGSKGFVVREHCFIKAPGWDAPRG